MEDSRRRRDTCLDSAERAAHAFCIKKSKWSRDPKPMKRTHYYPLVFTQASGESILGSLDLLGIGIGLNKTFWERRCEIVRLSMNFPLPPPVGGPGPNCSWAYGIITGQGRTRDSKSSNRKQGRFQSADCILKISVLFRKESTNGNKEKETNTVSEFRTKDEAPDRGEMDRTPNLPPQAL
ncbi:unnamed protein product [Dovyalis caffra]|uniref:Uncharacterized protein n=1 Tax=Dovyalis caffra TaxID=77055 RepID=A0AAV1S6L0_9ROSI|nr:unnamed protein product [Dovyalis caffra]